MIHIPRRFEVAKRLINHRLRVACSRSELTWRYMANFRPWFEYQWTTTALRAVHERIVARLKRDGIAITSVSEIMDNAELFNELRTAVREREELLVDEVDGARSDVENSSEIKTYLVELFGESPVLEPASIYCRFALQPEVLAIANGYFGMFTRLRYYNVWHNLPMRGEPRESQLWHRDPEDRYILKVFVYLTDVNEQAGPLSYVPGTHALGRTKIAPAATVKKEGPRRTSMRTDDAQMEAVVPRQNWITAEGPMGTVVFVDTRGFHKGGLARERDRIVYMCTFTSQGSILANDLFARELPVPDTLDKAAAFAIGGC